MKKILKLSMVALSALMLVSAAACDSGSTDDGDYASSLRTIFRSERAVDDV